MRVVRTGSTGTPLLANGGFEVMLQGKPASWFAWQQGFRVTPGEGRGGSQCMVCERREGEGEFGASQTLTLNRTNIAPFIIRGWSKAENVSGSPDNGYSLYVDIVYADGTPLWGQTASFTCGTHDWEPRQFVLLPDKPVKSLTLHCLFRGHTGKVWFDDASVEEVPTPAGAVLFQGVPLQGTTQPKSDTKAAQRKLSTRDGLRLTLRDNTITSLQVDGKELSAPSPSGFLARDFAADSDICAFTNGACQELGLNLEAKFSPSRDHLAVEGRVTDTTGRDRAVTLLFALPLDATGWQWGDDVRRSRLIGGSGEFANTISLRCGANGKMSLYPLAAVWNERAGLALALDMDHPAQYRLVYHAGTRQFFIAYDFGLTKDTAQVSKQRRVSLRPVSLRPALGLSGGLAEVLRPLPTAFHQTRDPRRRVDALHRHCQGARFRRFRLCLPGGRAKRRVRRSARHRQLRLCRTDEPLAGDAPRRPAHLR